MRLCILLQGGINYLNAMRSQARLQSVNTVSASTNQTAVAFPSQMIGYPTTITPPNLYTDANEDHAGTSQVDRGHIQHVGYPNLCPTAPNLPPDFHLRNSWNFTNPLRGSIIHTRPLMPQAAAATSPKWVGTQLPPAAAGTTGCPVISHGPVGHDSPHRAGTSVPASSSTAAAAAAAVTGQQAIQGLLKSQHVGYFDDQPYSGQSGDTPAEVYLPRGHVAGAVEQAAPIPVPQDAFESGELVPGTFSPLETALLRSQAAAAQVGMTCPQFPTLSHPTHAPMPSPLPCPVPA